MDETIVLIVGAGPVGLGLAMELSYRGVRSILIDQGDGVVRHSKMGLVSMRSMEFCRRWGIAERVRGCGFPMDYPLNQVFCTSLTGHFIAKINYPTMRDEPTCGFSPEKKQRCPQLWFDPILARAVAEQKAVDLRYHNRMESFEQDADGVRAAIIDLESGRSRDVRAAFMVGCDGAGSAVRKALGFTLEGDAALDHSVGIYLYAPDLAARHPMGPAERYILLGKEGTWGHLTVVDAKDFWRLTVMGLPENLDSGKFDAAWWVERCFGGRQIPYRIDAVLPWRRSRLVASAYSHGRVFLAGDACHVMAPNGGYGMNTGLGDAVDIGWKLHAIVQGWGGAGLLETYGLERRPVAWRNVNFAARNFAALTPKLHFAQVEADGPDGDAARRRLAVQMGTSTRQEWEAHGVNLGYRYEGSPLICPDDTPEPEDHPSDYLPSARAGHRAPHAWLPDGRSTLDLFGEGFVLLRFDPTVDVQEILDGFAAVGVPLRHHTILQPEAAALYERKLVLVRPDGHVAWRADQAPDDARKVAHTVAGHGSKVGTQGGQRVPDRARIPLMSA